MKWVLLYVEKAKVLSIHLFSKILNPAFLYLNAIGIIWRKMRFQNFQERPRGVINGALRTGHGQSIADRTLFHFAYK